MTRNRKTTKARELTHLLALSRLWWQLYSTPPQVGEEERRQNPSNEDDDEVAQMKLPAQKKKKQGQVTAIIQPCRAKTVHEHPFYLESDAEDTMGQLYKQ